MYKIFFQPSLCSALLALTKTVHSRFYPTLASNTKQLIRPYFIHSSVSSTYKPAHKVRRSAHPDSMLVDIYSTSFVYVATIEQPIFGFPGKDPSRYYKAGDEQLSRFSSAKTTRVTC
jgi:hypothetical protein